jgi:hypothetical protein
MAAILSPAGKFSSYTKNWLNIKLNELPAYSLWAAILPTLLANQQA